MRTDSVSGHDAARARQGTGWFAVLHVADFFLHAVLRHEPATDAQPAGLLDGTRKKAVLVAANAIARAAGVRPGQTAPQALASCAGLVLRSRSPAAEAEARAALLAAGFSLSPKIEYTSDGVCTADLGGLDDARATTLLTTALAQLQALGLPATGGLARTPLLALYAARSVEVEQCAGPDVCRVGSPQRGVGGGVGDSALPRARSSAVHSACRTVDNAHAFLAPLPLGAADPEPELAAVLASWGIHTLGALTTLSKEDVARRLGAAGLALWERAAGETTRVLRLVEPAREFVAKMEFEHEVETLEPLLFVLRRFVDRFALELETAQLAAVELALVLELVDATKYERSFRLPEPTTRAEALFRTLHTHLEQLRTEAPIKAVRLRVEPARALHRQQGLFETGLRDPHSFAETLARLVAIVGSGRVGTPYLENTYRPDAVVMETPATVVAPPAEPPPLPPLGLPLRRFRPPVPARVQVDDNRHPASIWSTAGCGEVIAQRGPWRGAGDWWEVGRAWEREEWDVELSGGGLYRVVHTPEGWLVEGEYD